MDPFTQKLLQRTQARKEQLAKKREELAAYRAAKNPTNHENQRRPLSEDNRGHNESNAEASKKIKIDDDAKDAQIDKVKNAPEIDANSPSIKARKERLIQMQQKAKENAPVPKKHWKQLDLGGAGGKDKTSSPSVAARSAAFETKATDQNKVHAQVQEAALPITPKKLSETRDIFEKGAQPLQTDDTKKKNDAAPPKPPRLAEGKPKAEEKKRKAPSPPTSDASDSDTSSKSVEPQISKRKAPSPPSCVKESASMQKVESSKETRNAGEGPAPKKERKSNINGEKYQDSEPKPQKSRGEGLGNTTVVICKDDCSDQTPTPKPRKRLQVAESTSKAVDPNTNPEEKEAKVGGGGPARNAKRSNVIVATAQMVDEEAKPRVGKAPKKTGNETVVVQACAVETTENQSNKRLTTTVKAVMCEDDSRPGAIRAKVRSVEPQQSQTSKPDKLDASAVTRKRSSRDGKASNQDKWDSHPFKVPEKRGKPQHKASENHQDDCTAELDETINLNDVNIHEITFSFDFSKFDEEFSDKEKFKMSYEEQCKKLEQKRYTSYTDKPRAAPQEFTVEEKGVHTSGYNKAASEQYAAKVKSPNRHLSPTEKTQTNQEKIKTLLEKAAFQQNIVLQASRAVNVCAATNDVRFGEEGEVEAERVLLLATERRQSCLDEVQRLKANPSGAMPEFHTSDEAAMPCKATVYLEGIQLPLKQEFMDSLRKGIRSDLGIYYFVCIVEQGPDQVFCSRVQSTTNATEEAMLKFCDKFVLENVKPNFVVTLKIFAMNVQRIPAAVPSTPKQKIFQSPKVIKNKLSVKRGMDIAASPKTVFRTSSFSLVGVTHLTLPLVNSKRFTLDKVPEGHPLKNYLQVNMRCIPTYTSSVKGFLTILEDVGGYGAWQRRWCTLESGLLQYWRYPGDETAKAPLGCLDLSHCVSDSVTTVSRDLCARPNTMELKVTRKEEGESTEVKYLLAADTKQDRSTWLNSLNIALKDYRAWNPEPLYPQLGHIFNQDVYMYSDKSLPPAQAQESDL